MKLSVLDQSTAVSGHAQTDAIADSLALARHCDALGYHRYWVSEHHHSGSIVGSAPEVLMAAIAATTSRIRVGSAGVMLPHYAPLKVAEQFRVLEAIAPGRIDLGLGRAPGGDQLTAMALRPDHELPGEHEFPRQLGELLGFLEGGFEPDHPFSRIKVSPAAPGGPEVWLLGSTNFSAAYAAHLGLPFCFAHFINPAEGERIAESYRDRFQPTDLHPEPRLAVATTVVCADDDDEAERQASSMRLWRLRLMTTGRPGAIPTIEEALAHEYSPAEQELLVRQQNRAIVGGPQVVRTRLEELVDGFGADEAVIVTITHSHEARRRSYELIAKAFDLPSAN